MVSGRAAAVSAELVEAIARRHGNRRWELFAGQGLANDSFALGADLVVRVARPGYESDLAVEASVLPLVHAAGLPVPGVVEYEPGLGSGRPYLVQQRMPGVVLGGAHLTGPARRRAWTELGAVLARLHRAVLRPPADVRFDVQSDPLVVVGDLLGRDWMGDPDAAWLAAWFDHLRRWVPTQPPPVLVHGDAAPQNVLVDPVTGALTALLDWGDAAVADPTVDLAKIPPVDLPAAVDGYAAEAGGTDRQDWAARALWHQLAWAITRLGTPPRPEDGAWSAPPAARLLQLTRFVMHLPSPLWSELLPPQSPE